MNYQDSYDKNDMLDFRSFEVKSLKNAVECLEYMLKQKNLEIIRLQEKIKLLEEIFILDENLT